MKELPKYIREEKTRHGKRVLYFRRGGGSRIRMPDDQGCQEFLTLYNELVSGGQGTSVRGLGIKRARFIADVMAQKIKAATLRDKKRARTTDITLDWVMKRIAAQGYACALTGIAFQYRPTRNKRPNPYSPSIDRIDNSKGYEKSNVVIVIAAINFMRLDWGDDVFDTVSAAYIKNKKSRTKHPACRTPSIGSSKIKYIQHEK